MRPAFGTLRVFADAEALAAGAAVWLADHVGGARPVVCLSGGSTPRRLYERLAAQGFRERLPWDRLRFAFGDERFVPPDDPASNFRMAREAMFRHVPVPPAHILPVPTTDGTPEDAAARYERMLLELYGAPALSPGRPLFDVTLLGLGEDGHTASLLPGEPVLAERTRLAAVVAHGRPEVRVTLTYPALESSRFVLFLVQGEGKRAILDRVLSGETGLPAGRLRPRGEVLWFVDRAAAGRWADAKEEGQG
jgi:6-phosphogluconolactonase